MNKKKIIKILLLASTIVGGMSVSSDVVKAYPVENKKDDNVNSNTGANQNGHVINVATNLRVRAAANTNSDVLGYFSNGDKVNIKAEVGNWYRINFNGKEGYVSKEYVKLDSVEIKAVTKKGKVVNVTTRLRIRQNASTTSAVIGNLHNGEEFNIISKSGQWYNIQVGSTVGFIHSDYVKEISGNESQSQPTTPSQPSENVQATGKVINVTSNLRVRKSPDTSATILGYLLNGEEVSITGESGQWYEISFKGSKGYASKEYIQKVTSNSGQNNSNNNTNNSSTTTTSKKGKVVNIHTTLNIRQGAGSNYTVIGHLSNGESIDIVGESGNWYKISHNGTNGYVSKDYVEIVQGGESSNSSNNGGQQSNSSSFKAHVVNVESSLRVRAEASTSSEILGYLYNGETVNVTGESGNWYKIDFKGKIAYVSKEYIAKGEGNSNSSNNGNSSSNNENQSTNKKGQVVNITSNLRVRSEANSHSMVLGYLLNGETVNITGESGEWYKISFNNGVAYVSKEYIKIVDGNASTNVSSTYDKVLSAMKAHLGSPYVWGGTGEYLTMALVNDLKKRYPSQTANGAYIRAERYADKGYRAFDCSGLMQWGFAQAGVRIGRSTWDQIGNGVEVSLNNLKPGDLLFYSNLEHVGMYIGNDQWIEAPNKNADVRIVNVPWSRIGRARRVLN